MINYLRLGQSQKFYEQLGFKIVDSPWWVSMNVMDITKPEDKDSDDVFYVPKMDKSLVASAEQSFLSMAKNGELFPGSYQSITPCFRNDIEDFWHQKYFMKNELIIAHSHSVSDLDKMINQALSFFKTQIGPTDVLEVVKTSSGYDIELNKVEVGSYGVRQCSFLKWIYGTALAEPRFTKALKL